MSTSDSARAGSVRGVTASRHGSSSDQRLLELAGRITDRDRYLCRILAKHRVLTTGQITDIGFTGARRTRKRLAELHQIQLLDRFRPRVWAGSAPHHWVLGRAGADLIAVEDGLEPGRTGWRLDTAAALAGSQRLGHLVGTNGTFTSLIATARRTPGADLLEWWSEAQCAAEWGAVVRPDGYGVWAQDGGVLPFLLEYDTGSERIVRLTDKLTGYADLAREAGHPTWVCFRFPTPGREAEARPALAHRTVPVATAVLPAGDDPAAAKWLPVGRTDGRLRLVDLRAPTRPLPGPGGW